MHYLDQEGTVVYASKDGRISKSFPSLEWLTNLCSNIPNRGVQIVMCYSVLNTVRCYNSSGNHHGN